MTKVKVLGRVLLVELSRTSVVGVALGFLAVAGALLTDMDRWSGLWMTVVLAHYASVGGLWPLALACGAWFGRREAAARMTDLVAATPRPKPARLAARLVTIVGCFAGGYAAMGVGMLPGVWSNASYQPPGWYWPGLVGTVAVAGAALLGFGVGQVAPSRLTAPLLCVVAVAVTVGLRAVGPGPVPLLLPGYLGETDRYSRLDPGAVAGQLVLFGAVAVTGLVLSLADTRRVRRLAAVPTALALVVALVVVPSDGQGVRPDPQASALVCADGTPRVCVVRLYQGALPELVGPAREALRRLGRLPDAPTAVVQVVDERDDTAERPADVVPVEIVMFGPTSIATGGATIEAMLLDGAGTTACGPAADDLAGWDRLDAARSAAGLWLRGADPTPDDHVSPARRELTEAALTTLRGMPEQTQTARVAALRQAALQCRPDLYEILTAA
ncbi:hypothetical protein [Micromonospora sp. SH-82]|uniref:hypothetical protein n=1 Tax=Micromonospora sp. SH-82 TaxID=3132938 RepID=UPI003EBDE7EA